MNTFKQISNVQNNGTNKAFIKIHIETIAVNLHKSTLTHRKTSVGLLSKKKLITTTLRPNKSELQSCQILWMIPITVLILVNYDATKLYIFS